MRRNCVGTAIFSILLFALLFLATHVALAAGLKDGFEYKNSLGVDLNVTYSWSGKFAGEDEVCLLPQTILVTAQSSKFLEPPASFEVTDLVIISQGVGKSSFGGITFIDPPSTSPLTRIRIPCPADGTQVWGFQYVGAVNYGPVFANVPLEINGLDASGTPQIFTAATDANGAPILNTSGDCFQPTSQPVVQDTATHTVFPQFQPETTGSFCAELLIGPADSTSPLCEIVAVRTGSPKQIDIRIQDTGVGLSEIEISAQENSTVLVPSFPWGTIDPVIVTATKIDQTQGSRIEIRATDVKGNPTVCDPVLVDVPRDTGRPVSETYSGLKAEESAVTVDNGSPGLRKLEVEVNGETFRVTGLGDGERKLLDVSSAMVPGSSNVITLRGYGKPGSRAAVMISNRP
jgi:hypothetical protein